MALIHKDFFIIKSTKLKTTVFGLVLFSFFQISCKKQENINTKDLVIFNESKIEILKGGFDDLSEENISVKLSGPSTGNSVLGTVILTDSSFVFKPIIPFTSHLEYDVFVNDKIIKTIKFKKSSTSNHIATKVKIYPTLDTLPENLLKVYLEFSNPMKEVNNSLDYVTVKNIDTDSIVDVFLKLKPELWNKERTRLTLWLDPGRIKTDLIPNQMFGLPILQGNSYSISIHSDFEDIYGNKIEKHRKQFYVTDKDKKVPQVHNWQIKTPSPQTKDTLKMNFNESLDAILAKESFQIEDNSNKRVGGIFYLFPDESGLYFVPNNKWQRGNYTIFIDPKLEDLAGNNLNRLFDADATSEKNMEENTLDTLNFNIH